MTVAGTRLSTTEMTAAACSPAGTRKAPQQNCHGHSVRRVGQKDMRVALPAANVARQTGPGYDFWLGAAGRYLPDPRGPQHCCPAVRLRVRYVRPFKRRHNAMIGLRVKPLAHIPLMTSVICSRLCDGPVNFSTRMPYRFRCHWIRAFLHCAPIVFEQHTFNWYMQAGGITIGLHIHVLRMQAEALQYHSSGILYTSFSSSNSFPFHHQPMVWVYVFSSRMDFYVYSLWRFADSTRSIAIKSIHARLCISMGSNIIVVVPSLHQDYQRGIQ